jgi:folylpolyglutamate synthase/dihydropteroate synthase
MSGELDIMQHTISAGAGAALMLVADRVVRFFMDRDRHTEEVALAGRLASIETKLQQLLDGSHDREALSSQLARLDERIKSLENR